MGKKVYYSDVANAAIRNVLCEISGRMYDEPNENYLQEAAKFFGYKCPYTGEDIKAEVLSGNKGKTLDMDHIIPENRFALGLNVQGNTVYVKKHANARKAELDKKEKLSYQKLLEEICSDPVERQNRIDKIKAFQEEYGYDKLMDACELIKDDVIKLYDEVKEKQKNFINAAVSKMNKKKIKINVDLVDFTDYLDAHGKERSTAFDYAQTIKKIVVNDLNSMKDLEDPKKMAECIALYKKGGSKYNPKDKKTVSALNSYAEFKGLKLTKKKITTEDKFKKYLLKQKSQKLLRNYLLLQQVNTL